MLWIAHDDIDAIIDVKQWNTARVYVLHSALAATDSLHACTFMDERWRPLQRV